MRDITCSVYEFQINVAVIIIMVGELLSSLKQRRELQTFKQVLMSILNSIFINNSDNVRFTLQKHQLEISASTDLQNLRICVPSLSLSLSLHTETLNSLHPLGIIQKLFTISWKSYKLHHILIQIQTVRFLLWNKSCNFPLSRSFLLDSDYSRRPFRGTNFIQSTVEWRCEQTNLISAVSKLENLLTKLIFQFSSSPPLLCHCFCERLKGFFPRYLYLLLSPRHYFILISHW